MEWRRDQTLIEFRSSPARRSSALVHITGATRVPLDTRRSDRYSLEMSESSDCNTLRARAEISAM